MRSSYRNSQSHQSNYLFFQLNVEVKTAQQRPVKSILQGPDFPKTDTYTYFFSDTPF